MAFAEARHGIEPKGSRVSGRVERSTGNRPSFVTLGRVRATTGDFIDERGAPAQNACGRKWGWAS